MHKNKSNLIALKPGDKIGFIAPAGPVQQEQIQKGLTLLSELGFQFQLGEHALDDHGLVASSIENRLQDIYRFLEDPQVRAIWALRGGYGSIQLLASCDWQRIYQHPKLWIGFSDLTAFQWALLSQTDIPSLSGFTMTRQFSRQNKFFQTGFAILTGERSEISEYDLQEFPIQILQEGKARGILLGGTLSMICSLMGTRFIPELRDVILYLEDVDEPLYRLDRYLHQLFLAGFFERVSGIILGQFQFKEKFWDVYEILRPMISPAIPVVGNFPYGHQKDSLLMPVGVPAFMQTNPFLLRWDADLNS